ncbi:hypothetical protein [uncultured Kordia sp.]|uniref:hypothetical protein n=1 Tax=uncultured Kordia sp. TaxID=507699 RepID=UPI0026377BA6|nr:hypothetical protein [uncultured Kordia sp.]
MKTPQELTIGIPLDEILLWQYQLGDQKDAKKSFDSSGNSFILNSIGTISQFYNTIHVYIAVDTYGGAIQMYAVPGMCDYEDYIIKGYDRYKISRSSRKLPLEGFAEYVNTKLVPMKLSTVNVKEVFNGTYTGDKKILVESIKDWNDTTKRDTWLSQLYTNKKKVVQAFDIDASDFENGCSHTCYLALKTNPAGSKETYSIDLVVENTKTGALLNLVSTDDGTMLLRDMARPVPPFGQSIYTYYEGQFGIYEIINAH